MLLNSVRGLWSAALYHLSLIMFLPSIHIPVFTLFDSHLYHFFSIIILFIYYDTLISSQCSQLQFPLVLLTGECGVILSYSLSLQIFILIITTHVSSTCRRRRLKLAGAQGWGNWISIPLVLSPKKKKKKEEEGAK